MEERKKSSWWRYPLAVVSLLGIDSASPVLFWLLYGFTPLYAPRAYNGQRLIAIIAWFVLAYAAMKLVYWLLPEDKRFCEVLGGAWALITAFFVILYYYQSDLLGEIVGFLHTVFIVLRAATPELTISLSVKKPESGSQEPTPPQMWRPLSDEERELLLSQVAKEAEQETKDKKTALKPHTPRAYSLSDEDKYLL